MGTNSATGKAGRLCGRARSQGGIGALVAAVLLAMALALAGALTGCAGGSAAPAGSEESSSSSTITPNQADTATPAAAAIDEDGSYTTKDEVAAYIHEFGHLPSNYVSKTEAKAAGWDSSEGNLDEVLPGKSIGGSRFYNDDGLLPDASGRRWTECDINYHGGFRGSERIVFSNDGLIYYTADHYETFERLY